MAALGVPSTLTDAISTGMASVSHSSEHFSDRATQYARHRPTYPSALVQELADLVSDRRFAWDAGCGSGQLSPALATRFRSVVATDASPEQIREAAPHPRVDYRCASAERSGLPDGCVDLAVAAQAAHWFDLDAYHAEVKRVVRPGGLIALISYGVPVVEQAVADVVEYFYHRRLEGYWPPERRHVEDGYRSLPFPFEEIPGPDLRMSASWTLPELMGYVRTWSAVRALEAAEGKAPIDELRQELAEAWGPPADRRLIEWPLAVRVGRVRGSGRDAVTAAPSRSPGRRV